MILTSTAKLCTFPQSTEMYKIDIIFLYMSLVLMFLKHGLMKKSKWKWNEKRLGRSKPK